MLVKKKKRIKNIININTPTSFTNLIKENYNIINSPKIKKIKKKNLLYKNIKIYLLENNYFLIEKDLIEYLKSIQQENKKKFNYQEIVQIPILIKKILTDKLTLLVKEEHTNLLEKKKIAKKIHQLKLKKDISINKYYSLTENTKDETISILNKEINKLNNQKVFKAFNLTLQSQNKNLSKILTTTKKKEKEKILLLNNIIYSIKQSEKLNIEEFYLKLLEIEQLLNKDKFYQIMSKESKNIYRKKIQRKRKPLKFYKDIIEKKEHIGLYLFKKKHPPLRLDYSSKKIPSTSKTIVNLYIFFLDKEQIDVFFIDLNLNKSENIKFNIINKNKNLEPELITYLNHKCNNLNKNNDKKIYQFYQKEEKISYPKSTKYIINLNEIEKIDSKKIKYLIGIMDHPLNKIVLDKRKRRVKKGHALLFFPIINKEENLYSLLYQKEEALLNHNEIYNLKVEQELLKGKNSLLRKKILNANYQKEILFTRKKKNTFNTYLKYYHHFIKRNISELKKKSNKNKLLLLTNLKKQLLYFLFLISILFSHSITLLLIEITLLLFFYQSLIKAINEYANIPEYLFTIIKREKDKTKYKINITMGLIFLLLHNLTGIIFFLSPLLSYIIHKKRNTKQPFTIKEIVEKKEVQLDTSILSNKNLSLYIDRNETEIIKYKGDKLLKTNWNKQLQIKIDNKDPLPLQTTNIDLKVNKVKINKEYKEIKLTIEPIISEFDHIEIKKLILENKKKETTNISLEFLLTINQNEELINPLPLTIKNKNHNIYITTYFLNTKNELSLEEEKKIRLKTEKLKIKEKKELYMITIISENMNIESLINQYKIPYIKSLFTLTKEKKLTTNYSLLNYLIEVNQFKINEARKKLLTYNILTTENLKKFNIDANIPLMILDLRNTSNKSILKETVLFFTYVKEHNFPLHLVIFNNIDKEYLKDLQYHIKEEKKHLLRIPGKIYILDEQSISKEEIILFYTLSYLTIDATLYQNLTDYLTKLKKNLKKVEKENYKEKKGINSNDLSLNVKERKKFLSNHTITSPTSLKTITTPNAENYTYINNKMRLSFKEKIIINNTNLIFDTIKYGHGYTTYLAKTKKLAIELTEFISYFEKTKFYKLTIKNNSEETLSISIKYIIHPTLIDDFPNSSRYILCKYNEQNNLVTMQNKLNSYFFRNTCYITCTEKFKNVNLSNPSKKIIEIKKMIPKNSSKELAFTLGISDLTYLNFLKEKYSNIATINTSLTISTNYFKTMLNKIKVKTNNQLFDDLINHSLLYKTLTEKIFQSSNQSCLRNSLNILSIFPEIAKETIINNIQEELTEENLFYLIYTTSIYIDQSEQTEILSEKIKKEANLYEQLKIKITNLKKEKNTNKFYLYMILEQFIKLSKQYDKNIDTKKIKEELTTIKKELLKDKDKISKIYRILLGITTNKEEKVIISKKIPTFLQNKEILYLYFLLKEQPYDILYEHFQNITSYNIEKINKYSSYLYQIGLEGILGFKRKNKKLYIKPHLPSSIKNYQLTYQYLNTTYHINIIINNKENKLLINNQQENIDYIELKNDYKPHNIDLYITKE